MACQKPGLSTIAHVPMATTQNASTSSAFGISRRDLWGVFNKQETSASMLIVCGLRVREYVAR